MLSLASHLLENEMNEPKENPGQQTAQAQDGEKKPGTLEQKKAEWLSRIKAGLITGAAQAAAGTVVSALLHPLVQVLAARLSEIAHITHFATTTDSWTPETNNSILYLSQGIADLTNPESDYVSRAGEIMERFEYWDSFATAFEFWTDHLAQDRFDAKTRAAERLIAILEKVALHEKLDRELPQRSRRRL